jgi:hypothetical protein
MIDIDFDKLKIKTPKIFTAKRALTGSLYNDMQTASKEGFISTHPSCQPPQMFPVSP